MSALFIIIGQGGEPLYELDVGQRADDAAHLAQFVAHASLDLVEHAGMHPHPLGHRCLQFSLRMCVYLLYYVVD